MADSDVTLLIYIPTYGRPEQALQQVRRLQEQRSRLGQPERVALFISINGDTSYAPHQFTDAGADYVRVLPVNVGGDANYCLAWTVESTSDYVWVLSDDDPVVDGGLPLLLRELERDPDLVLCSRSRSPWWVNEPRSIAALEERGAVVALFSAAIFRRDVFGRFAPVAFAAIFTHFAQIQLIQSAVEMQSCRTVSGMPMHWLIDYSAADQLAESLGRRQVGEVRGDTIYGALFLSTLAPSAHEWRRGQRAWWKQHWHRANMYRQAQGNYAKAADAMARGRIGLWSYYIMSLPPWWRAKDLIDRARFRKQLEPPEPQHEVPES